MQSIRSDLELLPIQSSSTGICGKVFQRGEPVYHCSCGVDGTCVLCHQCYLKSHQSPVSNHDVFVSISTGNGGCCDCGDEEAFKIKLSCVHESSETVAGDSAEVRRVLEFIRTAFNDVNVVGDDDSYILVLWNDESHSFDQVENTLRQAHLPLGLSEEVDQNGRSVVYEGSMEAVIRKQVYFQQVGLFTTISTREQYEKEQLVEEALDHIPPNSLLLEYSDLKDNETRKRYERFGLSGVAYIDDLLLKDLKYWKKLRNKISQILLKADKKRLYLRFLVNYELLLENYFEDREPETSVYMYTLQLFSTPSICALINKHGVIPDLLDLLTKHLDKGFKLYHLFTDIRYLYGNTGDIFIGQLLDFLSCIEYSNSQVKQEGAHVEYEEDGWVESFELSINIIKLLKGITCKDLKRQKVELLIQKSLEKLEWKQEYSFHHPIVWLIGQMMIKYESMTSVEQLRQYLSRLETKTLLKIAMKSFCFQTEIKSNKWVRNGHSIYSQLFNYRSFRFYYAIDAELFILFYICRIEDILDCFEANKLIESSDNKDKMHLHQMLLLFIHIHSFKDSKKQEVIQLLVEKPRSYSEINRLLDETIWKMIYLKKTNDLLQDDKYYLKKDFINEFDVCFYHSQVEIERVCEQFSVNQAEIIDAWVKRGFRKMEGDYSELVRFLERVEDGVKPILERILHQFGLIELQVEEEPRKRNKDRQQKMLEEMKLMQDKFIAENSEYLSSDDEDVEMHESEVEQEENENVYTLYRTEGNCIVCHQSNDLCLLGFVQQTRLTERPTISSCGHFVHKDCIRVNESQLIRCPLCKNLSNCVIPVMEVQGKFDQCSIKGEYSYDGTLCDNLEFIYSGSVIELFINSLELQEKLVAYKYMNQSLFVFAKLCLNYENKVVLTEVLDQETWKAFIALTLNGQASHEYFSLQNRRIGVSLFYMLDVYRQLLSSTSTEYGYAQLDECDEFTVAWLVDKFKVGSKPRKLMPKFTTMTDAFFNTLQLMPFEEGSEKKRLGIDITVIKGIIQDFDNVAWLFDLVKPLPALQDRATFSLIQLPQEYTELIMGETSCGHASRDAQLCLLCGYRMYSVMCNQFGIHTHGRSALSGNNHQATRMRSERVNMILDVNKARVHLSTSSLILRVNAPYSNEFGECRFGPMKRNERYSELEKIWRTGYESFIVRNVE